MANGGKSIDDRKHDTRKFTEKDKMNVCHLSGSLSEWASASLRGRTAVRIWRGDSDYRLYAHSGHTEMRSDRYIESSRLNSGNLTTMMAVDSHDDADIPASLRIKQGWAIDLQPWGPPPWVRSR